MEGKLRALNRAFNSTINNSQHEMLPIRIVRGYVNGHMLELLEAGSNKAWVGFPHGRYGDLNFSLGDMNQITMEEGEPIFHFIVGKLRFMWNKNIKGLYEVHTYVI